VTTYDERTSARRDSLPIASAKRYAVGNVGRPEVMDALLASVTKPVSPGGRNVADVRRAVLLRNRLGFLALLVRLGVRDDALATARGTIDRLLRQGNDNGPQVAERTRGGPLTTSEVTDVHVRARPIVTAMFRRSGTS
jgi:hypothetical protein